MEQSSVSVFDRTYAHLPAYPSSTADSWQGAGWADDAQVPAQFRMASTGSFASAKLAEKALLLLVLSAPTGVASGVDLALTSQRLTKIPYYQIADVAGEVAEATFASRIRLIQKVLAVSISDLASVLGVSRQAIYKWLSGGPVSDLNREKFEDLAAAANVLAPFSRTQALMLNRRRNMGGLTLVESMRSGSSARMWAEEISRLLNVGQVQRKMMSQMLDSSRRSLPALRELGVPLADEQDD